MTTTTQDLPQNRGPSRLSGEQIESLREALTAAFPGYHSLEQMVRIRLDTPLPEIVSEDRNLVEAAFELIKWAEKYGRIPALVWGALKQNPDNPALSAFAEAWRAGGASEGVTSAVALGAIQPPGGRYDPDWYIARPDLEDWVQSHLRNGVPVVLQGPRYMGRSWLLGRALEQLRGGSPETSLCEVNLGRLDGRDFARFARQLASKLVPRSPELRARVDDIWGDDFATVEDRTSQVVEDLTLLDRNAPFVLVYDVPDEFVQGPCWGPFIQLHRTWMQELSPRWRSLRLVFSWSNHPSALGYDTTSQLNREVLVVGDLGEVEVSALARRHGISWDERTALRARSLCGGHPFLTRQLFMELASGTPFDEIERDALRDGGVFATPVLDDLAALLRAHPALLAAVRSVSEGTRAPIDPTVAHRLETSGILQQDPASRAWGLRYGVFRVLTTLASAT